MSNENEAATWFIQLRLDDFRAMTHATKYAMSDVEYIKRFPTLTMKLQDTIVRVDDLNYSVENQIRERMKLEKKTTV